MTNTIEFDKFMGNVNIEELNKELKQLEERSEIIGSAIVLQLRRRRL